MVVTGTCVVSGCCDYVYAIVVDIVVIMDILEGGDAGDWRGVVDSVNDPVRSLGWAVAILADGRPLIQPVPGLRSFFFI